MSTQPSPGAMRAAKAIVPYCDENGLMFPDDLYDQRVLETAEIIDRETGVAELLAVTTRLVEWMDANGYAKDDQSFGARAALAKAEGKR